MKSIKHNNMTFRLPFADLLRPLTATERYGLEESINTQGGIQYAVQLYHSPKWGENCVIDGGNRIEIAAALGKGVEIPYEIHAKMTDDQARELAESLNLNRRHLSPEEQQAARAKRIERVAEKRAEGKSLRTIAEEEGVGVATVHADIKEAGVRRRTPETPEIVEGKDGKTYKSTRQEGAAKPGRKPKEKPPEKVEEPEEIEPEVVVEEPPPATHSKPITDAYGIPIQPHALPAWEAISTFRELIKRARELQREFAALAELPGGVFLQKGGRAAYRQDRSKPGSKEATGKFVSLSLDQFVKDLEDAMPTYSVCPWRFVDKPHPKDCTTCKGLNWAPPLMQGTLDDVILQRVREAHNV